MASFIGRFRLSSLITRCSPFLQQIQFKSLRLTACPMGAYDAEFDEAKKRLNTLKEDPGNENKLKIYALFKQVTVGKCNAPKPGMMDFVGKAKWQAWSSLGDLQQDEAQKQYIALVNSLVKAETKDEPTTGARSQERFKSLLIHRDGGVYKITLNRPKKKNAIDFQMYEEWSQALKEAADDKTCTLAVVTGAGDYYCSGNDLGNFTNVPPDGVKAMAEKGGEILKKFVAAFIDFPKPLIAVVNGPAVGVSVTVLGLFDVVYATDKATFHTPFSQLGQSPEGCSSYIFPRLMGSAKASELLLFNRKITAAQAFERNLVTEVFPDSTFQKEVDAKVKQYAQLPKQSLQKSKTLIRDADIVKLHQVNAEECKVLVERWQSEECMNAIMNFFQSKASKL
ncbi:hypothetical protein ACJMK2_010356 [Sinanodonta woodiana]|uniref:ACB domain-containing protein n=1 Tax=Sinanodonta woodiana TaxID=1069815 RepID=A0ABD3VI61_SINWO